MRDSVSDPPNPPSDPSSSAPLSALPDDVLDQYLAGQVPETESRRVQAYVEQRPEWRRFLRLVQFWLSEPDVPEAPDEKEAFERFAAVLESRQGNGAVTARRGSHIRENGTAAQPLRVGRQHVGHSMPATWRRVVLPIAIGAVAAVFGVFFARKTGAWWVSERNSAVATYVTNNGERANITLTDGSTVTLGVASRLEVPADYPNGNHTLRLRGEALFTVTHHQGAPFTVIAGREATQVLGTSFVVRHYPTDTMTTVAVREGKVMVHSAVITAARAATIGRSGTVNLQVADAAQFSFASGVLTLNSMSLKEAILELDRWYDVDVRVGDPTLMTQRITGDLPAGSLADLIALLQFDMRVVRNGRVLTLFPK